MNSKTLFALSFALILSGCAGMRATEEDLAAHYAEQAQRAQAAGNRQTMAVQVDQAIQRRSGAALIKAFFAADPAARAAYVKELQSRIDRQVSTAGTADAVMGRINAAAIAGIISTAEHTALVERLMRTVEEGNLSGLVRIDLSDNISQFPGLKSAEQQRMIADNTIQTLQDAGSKHRPVGPLIDYAARAGRGSAEWARIETLLPTMNIKRSELPLVARQYPAFADARRAAIHAPVRLQVKNADRLFAEDLKAEIKGALPGVDLAAPTSAKTIDLIVEKLRHDERQSPERMETVTYRQSDVDIVNSVLFMPQNASYSFDVLSGGNEIEYGYAITAYQGGRVLADELVRGKIDNGFARCQNARIQNVFGGVTRAEFTANADMQRRCSGPQAAPIDDLRKIVLERIVDGIRRIEPIKAANDLGS
ncbi:MAG: hypothetical protein PHD19_11685 [Dechloromonas sp.]|nr:hypothetical protein [Dechloromonas sp.]